MGHSDPERSEGEESHPFFTKQVFQLESSFAAPSYKLRASAQDSAYGDLPPRNDRMSLRQFFPISNFLIFFKLICSVIINK